LGKVSKKTLFQHLKTIFPQENPKTLYSQILCGEVLVNGAKELDPKAKIPPQALITFSSFTWVSRGGIKLNSVLEKWQWHVDQKIILDAGSSTGGFVQALLNKGAEKVFAIDVGTNQLHYSLRTDPRVQVMEQTNARFIEALHPLPHGATADLSFRGLQGVAGKLLSLTREKWLIALVKPQFEVHPQDIDGFDGVIKDPSLIPPLLERTRINLLEEEAFLWRADISSINGRKGNREFFFLLRSEPPEEKRDWLSYFESLCSS